MNDEDILKARIKARLSACPKYRLYCSACSQYLCTVTRFWRIMVHFDCRKLPLKYYNVHPTDTPLVSATSTSQ